MEYTWKQTIFTPEDIDGAGHYIVRESSNKLASPHFTNTGYLSGVMYKIGYLHNNRIISSDDRGGNIYTLTSMADGWSIMGYFIETEGEDGSSTDPETREYIRFDGKDNHTAKQKLCDYLNNNPYGCTYRFATQEEVVRVILSQKWRVKG